MGREYPTSLLEVGPSITVQGGIGTAKEEQYLMDEFGVDGTGWGTPFLVVPEATCVDDPTLQLLINAKEEFLYLSKVSPLGVPFNNLRNSGSERWTTARQDTDKPGSPCPKGYLKSITEFTEKPICTASTEYQVLKIAQIRESEVSTDQKSRQIEDVLAKTCLCDHLGNGSLLKLGIIKEKHGPQAVCPGPNLAWFRGPYSLKQMTDHIYGRGASLVSDYRPHMFIKVLNMNVEYYDQLCLLADPDDAKYQKYLDGVRQNLDSGIERLRSISVLQDQFDLEGSLR